LKLKFWCSTNWERASRPSDRRYNDKKITIFTSNFLDLPPDTARDESLTDRVGVRLRSRLHEMCRPIMMEGDDYREALRNRRGTRFSG
jgi:DNA replication protein DnaC